MPKFLDDLYTFVSRDSAQRHDRASVQVTSRGGLHVDIDTLFKNSDVKRTIEKAAERKVGSRSIESSSHTS